VAAGYGRIALIRVRQGARDDALNALRQGQEIIAQLMRRSRDNATLPGDLAWFDQMIKDNEALI
jgi:hypothetical protein